jgi:hypothetical protein
MFDSQQEFSQQQYSESPEQPAPIPTRKQSKPMADSQNNTYQTVRLVTQSPGELSNLKKQAELSRKLQKLQNQSTNTFEEELADGARAAGQTGRIVVENANPFTGPVRAYAYMSIIATSVGLGMVTLHLLGVLGGKVASNVKVQVRYGEQPTQTAPNRLTKPSNPPVVDWVPGGR